MPKSRILVLLLVLAIFFIAGCGREEDQDSQTAPPLADNIFTNPPEAENLSADSGGTAGNYFSIASEVRNDEMGPYLVYEGGEMHLLLRSRIGELPGKNFGIHLYVDGQPQPYHTAENEAARYMHSFPSMNGKAFTLDLIFTPVTGQNGDVLEIGFAIVAYPEYFIDDAWEGITMMDWSGMGMTVRMKYQNDPPSVHLPEVPDRMVSLSQAYIDLTSVEALLFSSGAYQKEVTYEIYVNGKKSYGNLFSVTGGDKLDVEFELKGSSAADFGLVLYLDHQPVSICAEDLIFVHTQNGKKITVKAEIDLSGFDGEGVLYAVIVPRNYRTDQLGGSCLLTVLGPYYLSDAASLEAMESDMSSEGMAYIESETEPSSHINVGYMNSISHGPGGVKLTDENGAYRLYEGGEMRLPYEVSALGMHDLGVGILLFVDGYPQPYKTAEKEIYAYMHTFYPNAKGHAMSELIFTPVVGEAGDTLELYTVNINAPDYFIGESDYGFAHTSGSIAAGTRLKYQQTPGAAGTPDANTSAAAFQKEYMELTSEEIAGWTDAELREEVEWNFFLNGAEGGSLTGVGPDETLKAYFEIWGNAGTAFGLVLYMNNEPISVNGSTMIDIDIQNGKKTVVDLEIPMTHHDGKTVVYAVLVPRNYRTIDAGSSCYIQTTPTFYIS